MKWNRFCFHLFFFLGLSCFIFPARSDRLIWCRVVGSANTYLWSLWLQFQTLIAVLGYHVWESQIETRHRRLGVHYDSLCLYKGSAHTRVGKSQVVAHTVTRENGRGHCMNPRLEIGCFVCFDFCSFWLHSKIVNWNILMPFQNDWCCLGWVAQLVGMLSCTPKGCRF